MPKLRAKNSWFRYFRTGTWKQYCDIWNRLLQIRLIWKFDGKIKMAKFGMKNALFGYFWPKIFDLGISGQELSKYYCHIWNRHPQICLFAKLHEKAKMSKFWAQKCLFWMFLGCNLKTILSYLKAALSNLLNFKISRKNKMV